MSLSAGSPSSGGSTTKGSWREKIPVKIFDRPGQLSLQVARHIASLVVERKTMGKDLVLGLPTGSTPIGVYQHLVRMHKEEGLDLSNVVTFNLDEYYPMKPANLQSYHRFMHENFFDHVNISEENIHIPKGDVAREELENYCLAYEKDILDAREIILMATGEHKAPIICRAVEEKLTNDVTASYL